jgi:hypothetical protein
MSGKPTVTRDLQTRIEANNPRSFKSTALFVLGMIVGIVLTVIAYEHYGFHLR